MNLRLADRGRNFDEVFLANVLVNCEGLGREDVQVLVDVSELLQIVDIVCSYSACTLQDF